MFDRGLIGISNELEILVSRQANDREAVSNLVNSSGRLLAPTRLSERPKMQFLEWHRANSFKS